MWLKIGAWGVYKEWTISMEKCPSPLLTTLSTPSPPLSIYPPPLATSPSSPPSTLIYDPLNSYPTPISVFTLILFFFFPTWSGFELPTSGFSFHLLIHYTTVLELEIAPLFLCIITFLGPRPTSAKVLIYANPSKCCMEVFHWRLTK